MLKKLITVLATILGVLSITYLYTSSNMRTTLNAQSAPVFTLPKGAKVVLGKYNNKEIVWDIGNNNNNGSYVLMSSKPIVENFLLNDNTGLLTCDGNYCTSTRLYSEINKIILTDIETSVVVRSPFIPSFSEIIDGGTLGLSLTDRAYKGNGDWTEVYWVDGKVEKITVSNNTVMKYNALQLSLGNDMSWVQDNNPNFRYTFLNPGGEELTFSQSDEHIAEANSVYPKSGLRPFATMNHNVNFAADTTYTDDNWHSYKIDTDNMNKYNEVNPLKLRIQSSLTATLDDIKDSGTNSINKTKKNSCIQLLVSANTGSNTKMSVILYNEAKTEIQYYKLGSDTQNGRINYSVDLTGIPAGKYYVAVINEEYAPSSQLPVESSAISNLLPLEIIEPHKLTYTKIPQSGVTAGDYEFSKNVNAGQTIGKITVNPQGVMPLTYTVESYGNDTYQNFELEGLNNGTSSSTSLNVKIKSNAPDLMNGGLKAGIYKFCVNSVDADGDPITATSESRVCTSFTVEKIGLTIAFDDSNQTKKSIADAATAWNETATANPNTGTKVTYSVSGGDTYLIDIDSDTGAITYKGNGAFGKVKIKATADDDPDSGNDNYNSAFTEKEIIIYKQVDGSVTPHANSSDSIIPTFTATDTNVKTNGIIGTIQGTTGTPDNIGGSSTITYKYGLETGGDSSLFTVDPNTGVIKTTGNLGVQSYHITVTVSDKWSTKQIPLTINVGEANAEDLRFYETSAAINMISQKTVTATDTGVTVFATVKGSTNNNPVTYKIKDGSTNIITINPNSGVVTINGVGTVTIVAEKDGGVGQAKAVAELTFTVTAGAQNFIYTDNAGNELPKDGNSYKAYSEVYAPNKTFQLYTAGNPTGSTVTYQLKAGSPTDVISVDAGGLVTILNASLNNQMGKVIVQATSHDPTGNYADKTIELSINIEKGTRTISFKEKPIYVTNGKGKVTPVTEVDGVVDIDGDVLIEVDTNEDHTIAWTNDNKTIDYNYSGDTGKDIKIHATKPMDRNYKVAEADGTIHIMGPDENILAITSPGQIIYGDHFTIRSSQYDADSTNVQYTFEVDKTTYISNPTVNGNSAEFDALQFSGSNKTTITVTRTADGETMLSKQVQVTVLPKPIEIIIDDKEKLKGEINPTMTYQDFRSDLVSWNGVQDVIQENDIKLSTTAKTDSSAGAYPIKGDVNSLNKTYPNYSFSFKEGTLTIKEENIEDDWYHLELDDGNNTAYTGEWTKQEVNIISDHDEYINLSFDQSIWKPNQVTVTREGETNQSFWMKKDSGAITKEKQELIKIDKTAPKVKSIKAKDSTNKLQDIINKLSGGIFFKPGTSFEITTDDSKDNLKVSGTKELSYKVYKVEKQARAGDELIKEGTLSVSSEKASIKIDETTGTYKVCVILTDNAENVSDEVCSELNIRAMGVDSDRDGIPDINIDIDGDGIPDLNVTRNPDDPEDRIPYLNIDTNGDGKPDMNIDTDGDGEPNLNTGIVKEWHPDKLVDIDGDGVPDYKTDSTLKGLNNRDTDKDGYPDLNIDLDLDSLPELNINTDGKLDKPQTNIDSDGDGIPDINIDEDKDGIPDKNIVEITEWKPNHNVSKDGKVIYDTMEIKTEDDPTPPSNLGDSDVKGSYYPGDNVGGAITGDNTNITAYMVISFLSISALFYFAYKHKSE